MKPKMNKSNSASLFHFTKSHSTLHSIVRKGLRFSFSFEHVASEVILDNIFPADMPISHELRQEYTNKGVAIPMVCFCDIPLMRAAEHSLKYGNYIIGLDKEYLMAFYSLIMNPILYVCSENVESMISTFSKLKQMNMDKMSQLALKYVKIVEKDGLEALESNEQYIKDIESICDQRFHANFLIGLTKPYGQKNEKGVYECFYDEREWRAFLSDMSDNRSTWAWGITKDEYNKGRNTWNKNLETSEEGYITISEGFLYQAINHVIVAKDSQIEKIANTILNSKTVFGSRDVSRRERLILISKVTSMERIALDY